MFVSIHVFHERQTLDRSNGDDLHYQDISFCFPLHIKASRLDILFLLPTLPTASFYFIYYLVYSIDMYYKMMIQYKVFEMLYYLKLIELLRDVFNCIATSQGCYNISFVFNLSTG